MQGSTKSTWSRRSNAGKAGMLLIALLLFSIMIASARNSASAVGETTDIVFVIDGSGSISSADWQIQRDGISSAIQDSASFPLNGTIAVGVVQWSYVNSSQRTRVEVPLTVLGSQTALSSLVADIQSMSQIGDLTNPGDGIRAGTDLLLADAENTASSDWVLCMSTDGTTNSGESLSSATAYAKTSGVDKYSVIGIEDPPSSTASILRNHYTPHIFGGGTVTIARNSVEFANLIVGSCLGDPVELRAIEVNQAVQDWHNSVPLIAEKRAAVRVFVEVPTGEADQRVVGRLYGRRNGVELPGSPLLALNTNSSVVASTEIAARRDQLEDSLNFDLPLAWRTGTVELEFDAAGTPLTCREPQGPVSDPANDCKVVVTFENAGEPETVLVGVRYETSSGMEEPSPEELLEQLNRLRTIFPVPGIDARIISMGDYAWKPSLFIVNAHLALKRQLDIHSCGLICTNTSTENSRYYGVLDGNGGGLANGIPGTVASGFLSGTGAETDTGYARNRGAHELSHVYGRHHAVDDSLPLDWFQKVGRCGEKASSSAPGHTPFGNVGSNTFPLLGPITNGEDNEIWGFDVRFLDSNSRNLAVVDPRETFELMSYCGGGSQGRWISQYTYEGLANQIPTTRNVSTRSSIGEYVIVTGVLDLETDMVEFAPTIVMTGSSPTPTPGEYRVQLLDTTGTELVGVDFMPIIMDADAETPGTPTESPQGLIQVSLPRPSIPIASITVLRNGAQIASLDASPNVPSVSVVTPSSGQVFDDLDVTFAWIGDDIDGEPLTYTVLYSADDGHTWNTLTVNTSNTTLTIPRSVLEASITARIEVIVSDGVNSSSTISERFTVENNSPIIAIDTPEDSATFTGLQNVTFTGTGYDSEDGLLKGTSLDWESDLDGLIGTGEELTVNASDLTEGTHVVTLTGTDTDGEATSKSVTIQVFRVAPPPIVTPTSACPVDPNVGTQITSIEGKGMGNTRRSIRNAKVVVPDASSLVSLHGQMAAKEYTGIRYVRFIYPDRSYVQVKPASDIGERGAISWWAADLDVTELAQRPFVKGRWFMNKGTRRMSLTRAFVLYPTHSTTEEYANVWATFTAPDNYISSFPNYSESSINKLEIPEIQAPVDVVLQFAITELIPDTGIVEMTVSAGGVEEKISLAEGVTRKQGMLKIVELTLKDVPAGTTEVMISLQTTRDINAAAALLGATAHYACDMP